MLLSDEAVRINGDCTLFMAARAVIDVGSSQACFRRYDPWCKKRVSSTVDDDGAAAAVLVPVPRRDVPLPPGVVPSAWYVYMPNVLLCVYIAQPANSNRKVID